ncbi:toprim domain-containing protein [Larkinella sp. VNQ87]|uniref:toprim domain-containing protein n=1 Tax=Larkinella sp. VNQ87 TaxID=3400921 RepID=UPI003C00651E
MNIDQANEIPIAEILNRLGYQPHKASNGKMLYLSPVRQEKTPSFYVYLKTNRWHDFGDGRGGDLIDFAQAYLKFTRETDTVVDALRWIKNIGLGPFEFAPVLAEYIEEEGAGLVLKAKKPIQHLGLIHYLEKRGIPLQLAHHHLKEIHVRNPRTGKSFFALGIQNEEGGHELRNPFFKGSLGPKAISFIRGREPKPKTIHIFEGVFDYLSAVAQAKGSGLKGDTIVLNSLSCLKQIAPYIQNYGYRVAYSWLDNDKAGEGATASLSEFCQTQDDLTHRTMNRMYAPHKDVNAWHMHQLGLTL